MLGKLLTEQKSFLKVTIIAGISKPVSKLAASIFPYLYQSADPQAQRNMRMCTAKWVRCLLQYNQSNQVKQLIPPTPTARRV